MIYFQQALTIKPSCAETLKNLASTYTAEGKPDEAISYYRQSLSLQPDNENTHSGLLFAMLLDTDCDIATHQIERKRWAQIHALSFTNSIKPHKNSPECDRRLRIGYVSADFRKHAAIYLFGPMIFHHDPSSHDVICYSGVEQEDELTEQLKPSSGRRKPHR